MFDSRLVVLNNNSSEGIVKFPVEIDREEKNRWIAEIPTIPGCNYYGVSKEQAYYVQGPEADEPLTRNPTIGQLSYYNQDSNVTALTDGIGNEIEHYTYDPFGNVTITSSTGVVMSGGDKYAKKVRTFPRPDFGR